MIQQKEKNQLQNWELVSVNPNDKNWNWKDLFCFWGVNIQSVIGFSLIASLYLIYNLFLRLHENDGLNPALFLLEWSAQALPSPR